MTVDRHVVGRVGKDHFGLLFAHQRGEVGGVEGTAAQDAMVPEEPQISAFAEWRPRGKLGYGTLLIISMLSAAMMKRSILCQGRSPTAP